MSDSVRASLSSFVWRPLQGFYSEESRGRFCSVKSIVAIEARMRDEAPDFAQP